MALELSVFAPAMQPVDGTQMAHAVFASRAIVGKIALIDP
jgi:hypothetical protein